MALPLIYDKEEHILRHQRRPPGGGHPVRQPSTTVCKREPHPDDRPAALITPKSLLYKNWSTRAGPFILPEKTKILCSSHFYTFSAE